MKDKLNHFISYFLERNVSDIHFVVHNCIIKASYRTAHGLQPIQSAMIDVSLFNYLKYISNLDLGNATSTQSGSFTMSINGNPYYFRFSLIKSFELETGVLRILNKTITISLSKLIQQKEILKTFYEWKTLRSGLILFCGPTGSGKTTTLYTLLNEIYKQGCLNVISLEDPIEIPDQKWLQLSVNEKIGFTYEEGIRQLLRHDPDIIMLGEIRDINTAKMAYRCALTGHLVFSTIHAKDSKEVIKRLNEFELSNMELRYTLHAICSQRLYPKKNKKGERICIYEVLDKKDLSNYICNEQVSNHKDIYYYISKAVKKGWIDEEEAIYDLSAKII